MKRAILIVSAAAGLLSSAMFAQEAAAQSKEQSAVAAQTEQTLPVATNKQVSAFNKASTFLGTAVKSADGKAMGKVEDLVFDLERGELSYAVIALNAGEGKGRTVAVPTRALKQAEGHLVLNMSEAVLAAAEGLQEGDWPGTDAFAVGAPAAAESGKASSGSEE